jgi:hypothetical protein
VFLFTAWHNFPYPLQRLLWESLFTHKSTVKVR